MSRCVICGCTEVRACELEDGPCGWRIQPVAGVGLCDNAICTTAAITKLVVFKPKPPVKLAGRRRLYGA